MVSLIMVGLSFLPIKTFSLKSKERLQGSDSGGDHNRTTRTVTDSGDISLCTNDFFTSVNAHFRF